MPSIEMSLALVVCHVSTTLSPGLIAVGVAVISAVGAGALFVSGGGGGGGAAFLWQPATAKTAASAAITASGRLDEIRRDKGASDTNCTISSLGAMFWRCGQLVVQPKQNRRRSFHLLSIVNPYFQLQLGMELDPRCVSCCCSVPSASIDHICVPPSPSRWKTMCRPSGDHEGKSLAPESCVS